MTARTHGGTSAPSAPTAFVAVSVATVWTSPASPRPADRPALACPADIPRWLASMTLADRRDLTGSQATQTQALYGAEVRILTEQGDWAEVAVPGQPTPKNPLGYPGWVPRRQLAVSQEFAALREDLPSALVGKAPVTGLYGDAALTREEMRVSAGTRLPVLGQARGEPPSVQVATPGHGPKWLPARDVSICQPGSGIPPAGGASLVAFARLFLGLPYLWGGRSGFAFDCSGFTSAVYQVHGITIPRDADAQARHGGGRPVSADELLPGDLLFYAADHGSGHIYHVTMYAGGRQMIEAHDAATGVRITGADTGGNYWGARRFLHPGHGKYAA
ncbi:MAG TPA: C40 family peptidase [Streptosporangiaceae bacterium]|nr:C40 family peptidase [Streptosporangiaceae bacterium]